MFRRDILVLFAAAFFLTSHCDPQSTTTPVESAPKPGILVELFTAEGCSSCPPADSLLRQLDAQADKTSHEVVVLGEHVDYWDQSGWRDRFSSHANTERQQEYTRHFQTDGPYTPEMVIDGSSEFLGNNVPRLQAALREAETRPKASLSLETQEVNPGEVLVRIQAGPLPAGDKHADLYVALADNHDETQVSGGENSGRKLQHVAVLRSLQKVSKVGPEGMEKQVNLKLPKSETPGNLRVIAFMQEGDTGPVVGATTKLLGEATR